MPEPTPGNPPALPLTKQQVLNRYFIEHRAKLLDVAAFLDRLDRAQGDEDHRAEAIRKVLPLLQNAEPHRTQSILDALSDPTEQPLEAAPTGAANGAPLAAPNP